MMRRMISNLLGRVERRWEMRATEVIARSLGVCATSALCVAGAAACSVGSDELDGENVASKAQTIWNANLDFAAPNRDAVVQVQAGGGGGACTGTLISPQLVLTAAHCLWGAVWPSPGGGGPIVLPGGTCAGSTVMVGPNAGGADVRNVTNCFSMWTQDIDGTPGIDPLTPASTPQDVLVLQLETPEQSAINQGLIVPSGGGFMPADGLGLFLDIVNPARLTDARPETGFRAEIVGWGQIETGGAALTRRFQGFNPFVYTFLSASREISSTFPAPYSATMPGDSGGPLFARDPNGNQLGIVGTVRGVAGLTAPDNANPGTATWIDVNVAAVRNWLQGVIADTTRPGYLIGERDYMGPCRPEVDNNCDRFAERTNSCPDIFAGGGLNGYNPSDYDTLPGLALYGRSVWSSEGITLNDRVKVQASDFSSGTVAAGPVRFDFPATTITGPNGLVTYGVRAANDVEVGSVISEKRVTLMHRYSVDAIQTTMDPKPGLPQETTEVWTQDGQDLSAITSYTAKAPPIALTLPTLPTTIYGPEILSNGAQLPSASAPTGSIVTPETRIGTLIINSGSLVRLGAGRYYFDNLTVEPNGIIEIDHSAGITEIYVSQNINFKGRIVSTGGRACNTLVGYFGTDTAHITGDMNSTFVAPNANVVLNSTPYGAEVAHVGAYYSGRNVTVHQNLTVLHCPLLCD